MIEKLQSAGVFLFDLDGTLYMGGRMIDGADAVLRRLRGLGKQVFFFTNNSSRSRADYLKKLNDLGIDAFLDEIITSGIVTIDYLNKNCKDKKVYLFGTQSLKDEFLAHGIKLCSFSGHPDIAVMGYNTEVNYKDIFEFATLIKDKNIPYICTHDDINCPSDEHTLPDNGSFIQLFQKSTGRLPDIVCGKPYRFIYDYILCRASSDKIVLTGDRLYTDMEFAARYGILSVLVLSGETSMQDYQNSGKKVDLVFNSVKDYLKYF